jgi:HK97 family phage prohead protease
MEVVRKSAPSVVRAIGEGQVQAIVSTATIDRDGEIILPSAYAARLDVYRRNPIHIWMHDPKSLDNYLGRCTSIEVTEAGLEATFAYAVDQPRGRQAYDLITMGALNCYSVGFMPVEWIRPADVERLTPAQRAELDGIDLSRVSRIYTQVELREISLVGIPSNTEAFVVGRAASDSYDPPQAVQDAAALGLRLRDEFGRGGTEVGVARARDLSNGRGISLDTIGRMVSYFARHEVDRQADGWGDKGNPSAGYIAWLLWGGDPGRAWAQRIWNQQEGKSVDIDTHDIAVRLRGLADAIEMCDMCDEGASDMIEHLNQALKILSSIAADYQASVETEVAEDAMEEEPVPAIEPAVIPDPVPMPAEPAPVPMPMDMAERGIKEGRVLSASNYAEFEGAHADLMKAASRIAMVLEACRPKAATAGPVKIDPLQDIGLMSLDDFLAQFTAGAE